MWELMLILVSLVAMVLPTGIIVAILIISLALEMPTGGASTIVAVGAFLALFVKRFIG